MSEARNGRIQTGGAHFNPAEVGLFFSAVVDNLLGIAAGIHDNLLIPVVYVDQATIEQIKIWSGRGRRFLVDSGVFTLAAQYAREHGVSLPEALGTPPAEMPGFEDHFTRYVEVARQLEEHSWGYIEIDLGGREHKLKTRARLEALGLRPMPVYHPLNDGWEYFDLLAQRYDRVCIGNIVDASPSVRWRLLSTIVERRRSYPDLWIHLLGMTHHFMNYAWPCESLDSSTFFSALRWGRMATYAAGKVVSNLPEGFNYKFGDDPTQRWIKMAQLGQSETRAMEVGWKHFMGRVVDVLGLRRDEEQGGAAWSFLAHWAQM